MKPRNRISGWALLLPSLLLNVALLLSTIYFLDQLEFFYRQVSGPGPVVRIHARAPSGSAPRLAVHELPGGGSDVGEAISDQP